METKIKPCPFCGSDNARAYTTEYGCGKTTYDCYVSCDNCGAEGPSVERDTEEEAREAAIQAWNTRNEKN